ncbi:SPOR domain-containing protein [Pseudomonas oligotrophica]|uniref:SPOR domain-containing protein n=1 Tax=Pseudomonas oligotrophica TaxID=2912055 RepID=UPI001F2B5093|nr:SPOR domain-containing protein [Pseudomonas oligotrophica]MCF7203855.1 SPOR domain-containing protein [Pseudomonas oligotrophica]
MRWILLLLLTLNVLFYLAHQQQAPFRVHEVAPVGGYTSAAPAIQLVSEAKPSPRKQVEEDEAVEANACLYLGGFDQEVAARQIEQRLLSLDIRSDIQVMERSAGTDYWVYLPPLASRAASLRQLRELQSRNIDSYIVTVGDLANGISLGIFTQRASAEGVVTRLQEAGYEALIRELPRMHRRYWVRVGKEDARLVDAPMLQAMLRDMPAMQHAQMPCNGVARPAGFE